ncbi:hypothetical protein N7448_000304 [Penicillium atrosanguineum]|nr:hypothetical protein N7448_000304 [Penicillium atrosanguineum]
MSRMWEVDPETRTKASPKFGTFICLNCAGTHRGLGVHISFVRSITMDAFKHAEIQRMELGGNEPWKAFYDAHTMTISEGRTFEDSTIKERYEGDAGEEWKERLSCKVEGRDYVPGQEKKNNTASRSTTPLSLGAGATTGTRTGSPAASSIRSQDSARGPTKKEQNEQYFSKLGSENAGRSNALPPSQGGQVHGVWGWNACACCWGSEVFTFGGDSKDPMGTLTKGLGWFASTVGKSAKQVNDSYLQPTAKQLAESDFAAQARVQAASWGQNLQTGVRGAADQFNRFVEGEDGRPTRSRVDPDHSDFWDDFSSLGDERQANANGNGNGNRHQRSGSRSDVIGTAAMRKGPASTPLANSTIPVEANATSGKEGTETGAAMAKGKDDWDDNW